MPRMPLPLRARPTVPISPGTSFAKRLEDCDVGEHDTISDV
jgi:hypothetical protein